MKTNVWNLTIRISHWLLAIGFLMAYISGENHLNENMHYGMGAMAASIAFMRLIYGFIGGKYAHFKDFPLSPVKAISYLKTMWNGKNEYVGHNPLASYAMIGILLSAVITGTSGYFLYQSEATGMYDEHFWEEVHEIFSHVFLFLVVFHLIGLVVDRFVHPTDGTITSMFTGTKNVSAEPTIETGFHKVFNILWLLIPITAFWYAFNFAPIEENEHEGPKIEQTKKAKSESSANKKNDDDDDDDDDDD
ncbi:DUF4405 domain-containing protein [bacterium]|nr:MAG: DUF4405 domain-containing protein [bacterium]